MSLLSSFIDNTFGTNMTAYDLAPYTPQLTQMAAGYVQGTAPATAPSTPAATGPSVMEPGYGGDGGGIPWGTIALVGGIGFLLYQMSKRRR